MTRIYWEIRVGDHIQVEVVRALQGDVMIEVPVPGPPSPRPRSVMIIIRGTAVNN